MICSENALELFEFEPPASAADKKLVDSLMTIYGARDVFTGLAIYSAAYFGDRKTSGCIIIAAIGPAFVDGVVCQAQVGRGEWNRWSHAPVMMAFGLTLLGDFDQA